MKIAVDFHSGLRISMLTIPVTYAWPTLIRAGGCSLTLCDGVTHETAGSVPLRAAWTKSRNGATFALWPSCLTVVNHGSGFQIPGVEAFCGIVVQNIVSSSQSGSPPCTT